MSEPVVELFFDHALIFVLIALFIILVLSVHFGTFVLPDDSTCFGSQRNLGSLIVKDVIDDSVLEAPIDCECLTALPCDGSF